MRGVNDSKLDHFIKIINIYGIVLKISSLQNSVSKFTPKKFYEIDPRCLQVRINVGIHTIVYNLKGKKCVVPLY